MFSRFFAKLTIISIMSLSVLFISGAGHLWATSVDVTSLQYIDDSGREIVYDFSAGTVSNNAISLPAAAIQARGAGEDGASAYSWGYVSGMPAITLSLDTTGKKATISPVSEGEGVAVLYTDSILPPQTQTDNTSWLYILGLKNFNFDPLVDKAYIFDAGLGRDEEMGFPYNEAFISVKWVKGFFDGEMYAGWTLIIEALVDNGASELWSSNFLTRTGLNPAETTLTLHLEVTNGNNFSASVFINDDPITNLGEYTLTMEDTFERLPGLFPFFFMEEESASAEPEARVYSIHLQRDGGPYEVGFEVRDPLHSASAVRVTNSTYLGDGIDLNWDDASKSWHSSQTYRLGFTQVTDPYPSFTFTLTPQTGGLAIADQIKSVTGYVTEFATNLSPSGDVSSNPLFTWTGITGASGYGIEVFDTTERVWNMYNIPVTPSNSYSLPYTGSPLTNGVTYNYNITAMMEQGDSWNSSIVDGSFTYTGTSGGETGGVNLLLVATGHPPVGFNFMTGQVASILDDPAINFGITGYNGNEPPYSAYGSLSMGVTFQDMGLMSPAAFDLLESAPTSGYVTSDSLLLTEGHVYAFMLGNGTTGMIVVRSVTVDGTTVTMSFDYKYFGSGGGGDTITFNGTVKTAPNWPVTDGMLPAATIMVNALNESTSFANATTDAEGKFSMTGIPASSNFRLMVLPQPGSEFVPAWSKWMNWDEDITGLLPFVLFTQAQYDSFGNDEGNGMILGRVALASSPTTFLAGAVITAREWTSGVLGETYPVTYTSGSATQADGVYMVKNVPAGKTLQVTATLEGYTFEFNNAIVSVAATTVSEESFFAKPASSSDVTTFFNEAAFISAIPGSTLIDFDELDTSAGNMTFSGNEYAGQGIAFTSPNSQDLWVAPPPTSNWTWSSNYLSPGALPFEGGDSNGDSLTLTFSTPVHGVGFTFLDMPNTGVATIRAYDESDNLIHETLNGEGLIGSGDQSMSAFWGIFSAVTPIARIEIIDPPDNGDDLGFDNFYFSTTSEICSYEISPASASLSAAGGSGTIAVTTGTGCYWTAVSRSAWLHVTAGTNGTGSSQVSYSVDANYGAARTGTIMIGGKTFTVTQEAAGAHTEEAVIRSQFEASMGQFNANNFDNTTGFATYVSDYFFDFGMDKTAFIAEAQEDYDESVPMTWTIDSILGTGDHAAMNLTWGDGQKDTLYFIKASGVWLLFGNQYLFDFWAGSGHHMYSVNTHPYWVSLDVEDPDESSGLVITGVNVTGPGITGGISLYHDEQSGIWHSWSSDPFSYDDLSPKWETQPAVPLEYTFTISYTGGAGASPAIQTSLINSFVNDAPPQASISPAADEVATRPLVFSWDSAGAGYRYKVEINDVNFNRIWDSDDLTGTTLTYNGPPLGGGSYIFNLITEDGYESMSMVNIPFELPPLYQRIPVTSGTGTDNHPAWSPDGSKIAFTSDRSGTDNIWVINRDGSGLKQLTTFTGYQSASYPSFSPDGTKIAFILRDTDPTIFGFGVHSLYTMNTDGTVQTIMPLPPGTGQDEAFDSWLYEINFTEWLDNDRIMFVSFGPDGGSMKFYKYTLSTEQVEQIVPSPEEANDFGEIYKISWNDTLGRLAFDRWPIGIQTMSDTGVNYEILDIPRVGGEMDTPAQPGWRPDGAQLAFVKDYYSVSNIAIFNTASKTAIVENTATDDEWPAWSPDGNAIAFVSNGKIWLMALTQAVKGDLNNDKSVDLADAILALKSLAGLGSTGIRPYYSTSGADVNGDGRAGFAEIFYILQNIAGL